MKKYLYLLLLVIFACEKNPVSKEPQQQVSEYTVYGKPAIVMVLENNDSFNSRTIESAYKLFLGQALQLMSDFFEVPKDSLQRLTLNEIIDVYGEPWQIEQLEKVARSKYLKVVTLTDEDATHERFLDELQCLSRDDYDIDVILNLHANHDAILFSDGLHNVESLIKKLRTRHIHIRALYQTCCYGNWTIPNWLNIGPYAVNGAHAVNNLAMFSPIYFLEYWMAGASFEAAVQYAYEKEISQIRSYDAELPISSYVLTDDILKSSEQFVHGLNSELKWNQFPVEYKYPPITEVHP